MKALEAEGIRPYVVIMYNPLSLYTHLVLPPETNPDLTVNLLAQTLTAYIEQFRKKVVILVDGKPLLPPSPVKGIINP